jgi:hypothetical protein
MEPIRSHDALFRFVFGEPEQMAELLGGCLPPALVAAIRWPTLHRLPDTFVDRVLQARRGDLFFAVELDVALAPEFDREPAGEGDGACRQPHAAAAGADRAQGAGRSLRRAAAGRLCRAAARGVAQEQRPEARTLPAVLTFVLHHGDRPWQAPTSVHELVDTCDWSPELTAVLAPRQLRLPFVLLDLAHVRRAARRCHVEFGGDLARLRFLQFLRGHRLPQALRPSSSGGDRVGRAGAAAPARPGRVGCVMLVVPRARPRGSNHLAHSHEQDRRRGLADAQHVDLVLEMGEERGREKAELRGMRELLRSLLQARFGPLPEAGAELLAAADAATLQRWSLRVLTAHELAEVFADGSS